MSTQVSPSPSLPSIPSKSESVALSSASQITPSSPVDEQIIAAQMIDQLQYINTQYHTQQPQYNYHNNSNGTYIKALDNRNSYPSILPPHTQYNIQHNNTVHQHDSHQPDQTINDENQPGNTQSLNSVSSNGSSCHQCKTRRCITEMYYCNGIPVNKRNKLNNGLTVKYNKKKTRICRKKYAIQHVVLYIPNVHYTILTLYIIFNYNVRIGFVVVV